MVLMYVELGGLWTPWVELSLAVGFPVDVGWVGISMAV